MESNVETRFKGLIVYSIPYSRTPIKPDRASYCFNAQCQSAEPVNPYFKCDKCLYSHRHDDVFTIWLAHKRMIGEISGDF